MLEHIIQSISEEHKFIPNIEKRSLDMANKTQHNTTYNTVNSTQHILHPEEVSEEKTLGNIPPQIESIAAAISGINTVISDLEVQLEPILKARPVGVEQDKTNYPPLPRDNKSDLAIMLQRIACDLEIVNTKLRTLWAEVDL